MPRSLLIITLVVVTASQVFAQKKQPPAHPPTLAGAEVEIYKEIGDVKLNMYIFKPADHKASDRRAAIVFFFGGGWKAGTPKQFHEQCKHLAERGMVAMAADYRVASRHQTKAVDCVRDAKSAVRWIRENAKRLGIDPNRVAAGGGSAGGHIAACTGTIVGYEEDGEDTSISSVPNAMALFNPAVALASFADKAPFDEEKSKEMPSRAGVDPKKLSPLHHVAARQPPTIIFHGKDDPTVLYWTVERFAEAMKNAGNRCELKGYAGEQHGFFNYGRGDNSMYKSTLAELDRFLVSLGYLEPRT